MALLPYVRRNFSHISKALSLHNIKTEGLPLGRSPVFLTCQGCPWLKKTWHIQHLCECGKIYTRQTGNSIQIRSEAHHQQIWLYHPDKSAMMEHSINLSHGIHFNDTSILAKKVICMELIIRKQERLNSILRTWTGRKVSLWVGPGNHSFKLWLIAGRPSLGTSDFLSFPGLTTLYPLLPPLLPSSIFYFLPYFLIFLPYFIIFIIIVFHNY